MKNIIKKVSILTLALGTLIGCDGVGNIKDNHKVIPEGDYFVYENVNYDPTVYDKPLDPLEGENAVYPLKNKLRNDFAFGMDISSQNIPSYYSEFYERDGHSRDFFELIKEAGVNFIRLRLWNDPKSEEGKSYGGGHNDFDTDLKLARQAKRVGLNIMIDFHYSDLWATAQNQKLPKAWANSGNLEQEVYDFTYNTLSKFKDADIDIDAVQLGNEINNGLLWPYAKLDETNFDSSMDKIAGILKKGVEATKKVYDLCQTVVHNSNVTNNDEYLKFYQTLKNKGVDYDIIGASYYPHLHGTTDNLYKVLNNVTTTLDKPVMIVETAFAKELYSTSHFTHNFMTRDLALKLGYNPSVQYQTTMINQLLDVLSQLKNNKGLGMFYFEPNFTDNPAAYYYTRAGFEYLNGDIPVDNPREYYSSCDSTALFFKDWALLSLYAYQDILKATEKEPEVFGGVFDEIHAIEGNPLPKKILGYTNYGKIKEYDAEFDDYIHPGSKYTYAKIEGVITKINIKYDTNYLENSEFNKSLENWEVNNISLKIDTWFAPCLGVYKTNEDNYKFSIKQSVQAIKGRYTLSYFVHGKKAQSENAKIEFGVILEDGLYVCKTIPCNLLNGVTDSFNENAASLITFDLHYNLKTDQKVQIIIQGNLDKDAYLFIDDIDFTRVGDL